MKEPMTEARKQQLRRLKKRKRRKKRIRACACMVTLCLVALVAVQKTATLLRTEKTAELLQTEDSEMTEETAQSYSGQGGSGQNNTEKKRGFFGITGALTQADKLQCIEESDEYPEQLKEMAEKNSETIDFVYDYPKMKDKKQKIDLSKEAKSDTVPLLLQWDERWGYTMYSGGFLGYTGCGPTNLAMVVLYLTGDKTVTPASVAEYAESAGYSVPGSGSSWTLISEGCEHYGIHAEEVPMAEDRIRAKLDAGCPVIINVGPGEFTDSGHFMTIIGYDSEGFIINDTNSRANSEKRWTFAQLNGQIRNLWAMSKEMF